MISNSNKSLLNLLLLINQPEVEAAVWRQKGKEGGEDWELEKEAGGEGTERNKEKKGEKKLRRSEVDLGGQTLARSSFIGLQRAAQLRPRSC